MHIFLAAVVQSATALPPADAIRRTAQEVIDRPEFQPKQPSGAAVSLMDVVLVFLERLLKPIYQFFAALWDISPVVAVLAIIVLSVLLVAVLWHLFYTFKTVLSQRSRAGAMVDLERARQDPQAFEQQAGEAARRQDYLTAVRLLFRASLLRLEQNEHRKARPGLTNREWLRRYQHSSVFEALQRFVDVIDIKWYGGGNCTATDYETCAQAHAQIRGARAGGPLAHSA